MKHLEDIKNYESVNMKNSVFKMGKISDPSWKKISKPAIHIDVCSISSEIRKQIKSTMPDHCSTTAVTKQNQIRNPAQ